MDFVSYAWLGTYGNFEIMPLMCPDGFDTCTTRLDDRERLRKNNTDGSKLHLSFPCSHTHGALSTRSQRPLPDILLSRLTTKSKWKLLRRVVLV